MERSDCFAIGRINRAHKFKDLLYGQLKLQLDLKELKEPIYLEFKEVLVPFFVDSFSLRNDGKLQFSLLESEAHGQPKAFAGKDILLPKSMIEGEDLFELLPEELVGFELIDQTLGSLGNILDVISRVSQPLLVIEVGGEEAYIPLTEKFLEEIDPDKKQLKLDLPEGLLDVNAGGNDDRDE